MIPRHDHSESSNRHPYGRWVISDDVVDPKYLGNDCENPDPDVDNQNDCLPWDIALVRFVPKPGSSTSTPKKMGWAARPGSYLHGVNKYRRGYPDCDSVGAPVNCVDNCLYGDGNFDLGTFHFMNPDGWNRCIFFSSDASPADSGSGAYYIDKSSGKNRAFGVTIASKECWMGCTDPTPSLMRRITPIWFDAISSRSY